MLFVEDKNNTETSYFECQTFFRPINGLLEVSITAEKTGPDQTQVDFFRSIEERYDSLTAMFIPLIEAEFNKWNPSLKILNFQSEFHPVFLEIPDCRRTSITWKIVFETKHDRRHTISCSIENFEIKDLQVDG